MQELPRRSIENSRHSKTHWRRRDHAWADGSCRYSTQMERIPVSHRMSFRLEVNPSSWTHRRWKGKKKKGDTHYSSHHQTHFGTKQKKNSTTTYRGRQQCTLTANRSVIRTPSTGSTCAGHKKMDWRFGRQGLTPLSCTIQCWPAASKNVVSMQREKTKNQRLSTPRPAPKIVLKMSGNLSSNNSSSRTLSSCRGAAPRHPNRSHKNTNKQRETCCGGKSIWSWCQNSRN